ncbi:MAG: carboxylating nicotinate-nucleotide diphosphorylase [Myxococcota bacterium]|nr:carboxylating nicotinate-nucleotide diphosphorylase [Myxococcota bacterium]
MSELQLPAESTWRPLLDLALAEDLGPGDVTSRVSIPRGKTARARIEAREDLVACGLPLVAAVFRAVDVGLALEPQTEDGKDVTAGAPLLHIEGSVHSILAGERLSLNFLGHLSGVATTTRRYVDAVRGTSTQIVDTRKTLPGFRMLDKYAVLAGGGTNHRIGLFDGILLKDNHIAAAGGVAAAVRNARTQAPANLRVQCEVESLEDARAAWEAGADMLLLDNRTPDEIRDIIAACPKDLVLEASGGITLDNVRAYAQTGVHRVSIGALTHSAKNVDVALEIDEAGQGARRA